RNNGNNSHHDIGVSREDLLLLSAADREFALEDHMRRLVANVLQIPARQIDRSEPLGSYGLESLKSNQLIALIEDSLQLTLPPTTIFNYPSVAGLSRHLADLMELGIDSEPPLGDLAMAQEELTREGDGIEEIL